MRSLIESLRTVIETDDPLPTLKPKKPFSQSLKSVLNSLSSKNPVFGQLLVRSGQEFTGKETVFSFRYGTYKSDGKDMAYVMFKTRDDRHGVVITILDSNKVEHFLGDSEDAAKDFITRFKEAMDNAKAPESKNKISGFKNVTPGHQAWSAAFKAIKKFAAGKIGDETIMNFLDGADTGARFAEAMKELGGSADGAINNHKTWIRSELGI